MTRVFDGVKILTLNKLLICKKKLESIKSKYYLKSISIIYSLIYKYKNTKQ